MDSIKNNVVDYKKAYEDLSLRVNCRSCPIQWKNKCNRKHNCKKWIDKYYKKNFQIQSPEKWVPLSKRVPTVEEYGSYVVAIAPDDIVPRIMRTGQLENLVDFYKTGYRWLDQKLPEVE